MSRPPLPPFTHESAVEKVRLAEDGWNTRNAAKVALAYTSDTRWRNRVEFVANREDARAFLTRKWNREHEYRLIKELGPSPVTASPSATPMSIAMTAGSGSVPTGMRTGTSPKTV